MPAAKLAAQRQSFARRAETKRNVFVAATVPQQLGHKHLFGEMLADAGFSRSTTMIVA